MHISDGSPGGDGGGNGGDGGRGGGAPARESTILVHLRIRRFAHQGMLKRRRHGQTGAATQTLPVSKTTTQFNKMMALAKRACTNSMCGAGMGTWAQITALSSQRVSQLH